MVVIKAVIAYLRAYPNALLKNQRIVDRTITSHCEKHRVRHFPFNNLGPKGTFYDRNFVVPFSQTLGKYLEFRHDGGLPSPSLFINQSFITSLMEYTLSSLHSSTM
jgi:hypothetical protein